MVKHGVATDIVELDPVVYRYATEFFGLAPNHTAYIEDAVGFVRREAAAPAAARKKYDYVLHDVFTGGAVPASLFTIELFEGLRALMSDDGVIAIVRFRARARLSGLVFGAVSTAVASAAHTTSHHRKSFPPPRPPPPPPPHHCPSLRVAG